MSYPKDIFTNIDAFLKGNLPDAELQEFEAALLQSEELREKVEHARALQKLVFQNRLLAIKDLAKQEETRLENKKQSVKKGTIGAAFLTLLLAVTGILLFNKNEDSATEQSGGNSEKVQVVPGNDVSEEPYSEKKPDPELPSADSGNSKILQSNKPVIPHSESYSATADTILSERPVDNPYIKPEVNRIEDSKNISDVREENTQPCDLVHLKAKISTTPTCTGSADGKIEALNISGGTMPYTQNLFINGKEVYSNSGPKAGNYELVITDSKNCQQRFAAQISEKSCPVNDYFNPSFGEVWNIPVTDKSGKLTIYSKTGTPVYQMDLKSNTAATWNGADNYDRIEAGYFIFVIEYEDGAVLKGSVTITL